MQTKFIPSILCIFSLLVIVRSQITPPDNYQQYYKCFTYAECVTGTPAHQQFMNCANKVTTEELYPGFQYTKHNYASFNTSSIFKASQEYCNLEGKAQEDSIVNTLKGLIDFTNNKLCPDPNEQEMCNKYTDLLTCFFNLLDNLMGQNVCTLNH